MCLNNDVRIFIDGDACTKKDLVQKFANKKKAEIVTVVSVKNCTDMHRKQNTIVVDSAPQAADIEIFNRMSEGDLVITKDYGLASLVLGKNGKAMAPNGFVYTKKNIGMLLQQRYVNGVLRSSHLKRRKRKTKYQAPKISLR